MRKRYKRIIYQTVTYVEFFYFAPEICSYLLTCPSNQPIISLSVKGKDKDTMARERLLERNLFGEMVSG